MRFKTNDFILQPTYSYTHSQSPTKPVAVIPPMPTPAQPTATAPSTATSAGGGWERGTINSLRTSKPLGPRSSPRVGTSLSGRGDHDHDHPESPGERLHVEVEEMYRDEGEKGEEKHGERGGAPFRAPSSASVSTSFSASTHTSSSKSGKMKSGKMKSEGLRRAKGGKYMQLEEGGDDYERGREEGEEMGDVREER